MTFIHFFLEKIMDHDPHTYQHSLNVSMFSVFIAKQLKMDATDRALIMHTALLHDLGKIQIPLPLLQKSEPLNSVELEIIHDHPVQGVKLAGNLPSPVSSGILCHHESFDGNGYPQGLKGEDIPFISRIISIADAFDAMVSVRPYSRQLSIREATNEIRRCAEEQFDPYIIKSLGSIAPNALEEMRHLILKPMRDLQLLGNQS